MTAFLLTPVGRALGGFVFAIMVIGGLALTFRLWLANHDKQVIAAQVALFEKTAAEAKAGEETRQASAVNAAVGAYRRRLAEAQAAETRARTDDEQRIAEYETRLTALKRQCLADDDDVDFVVCHH